MLVKNQTRRDSIFEALEKLFFPKKKDSVGIGSFLLFVLVSLITFSGFLIMDISKKTGHNMSRIAHAFSVVGPSIKPTVVPTPTSIPFNHQPLQKSYEKIAQLKTMQIAFQSNSIVKTTSDIDNRQQNLNIDINGYIKGSKNGAPIISELTVVEQSTGQTVNVGMAITRDNSYFVKTPTGDNNWNKRSISHYSRIYENMPLDGSTFGFNFIETFFSKNNALFYSVKRESIQQLNLEKEGQNSIVYSGKLDIEQYLKNVKKDETISAESKENTKKTLSKATVNVKFFINAESSHLEKVIIDAKNLLQIDQDRAEELGYDIRYDLSVIAHLSNFNQQIEELVPESL